jgi:hypothetical protein
MKNMKNKSFKIQKDKLGVVLIGVVLIVALLSVFSLFA